MEKRTVGFYLPVCSTLLTVLNKKKAVPIDLDKGAFSDSSFENVFEDEVLERTFREIAPIVF